MPLPYSTNVEHAFLMVNRIHRKPLPTQTSSHYSNKTHNSHLALPPNSQRQCQTLECLKASHFLYHSYFMTNVRIIIHMNKNRIYVSLTYMLARAHTYTHNCKGIKGLLRSLYRPTWFGPLGHLTNNYNY